jgi:hypothetical protein
LDDFINALKGALARYEFRRFYNNTFDESIDNSSDKFNDILNQLTFSEL